MVSTLVRASLSHYVDFCLVDSLLVWSDEKGDLIKVPSSKSDVFSSSDISIVEKRLLMRFLQAASSIEINEELESRMFEMELKGKFKFTKKLMNFVMFAMCMCQTPEEGLIGFSHSLCLLLLQKKRSHTVVNASFLVVQLRLFRVQMAFLVFKSYSIQWDDMDLILSFTLSTELVNILKHFVALLPFLVRHSY
jgi:hypothetical protein